VAGKEAEMRITWRDGLATVFVFTAVLVYALWLAGVEMFGVEARGVGAIVLGLGLAASIIAVVYGVGAGLLRANRAYLLMASLVGLVALVSGVVTLTTANESTLGVLVVATALLWVMATLRHEIKIETPAEADMVDGSLKHAA
jgi:hypothetical protein